jgi:hypothetical protein
LITSSPINPSQHNLKLTNPSGDTCYLYMNSSVGSGHVLFTDGSLQIYKPEAVGSSTYVCQPVENLSQAFCNSPFDGTWQVDWENTGPISYSSTVEVRLHIYARDDGAALTQVTALDVPWFRHNKSTNRCEAVVPERWVYQGMRFGFNSALWNVMEFEGFVCNKVDPASSAGTFYTITTPQVGQFSANLDQSITISQNQQTVTRTVSYPSRILIYGELPTRRILSGSADGGQSKFSGLIESFLIDPSSFDGSTFVYTSQLVRWHDIIGQGDLRNIALRVMVEFLDGTTQPLYLKGGETAVIQLQFHRKG